MKTKGTFWVIRDRDGSARQSIKQAIDSNRDKLPDDVTPAGLIKGIIIPNLTKILKMLYP